MTAHNCRSLSVCCCLHLAIQSTMTNFHLIPLCLVLTFRSIAWAIECPSGFVKNGESCYYFSNEAKSWINARSACLDLGAKLLEIDGDEENTFITDTVYELKADMWTGGNDRLREGRYVWSFSQTLIEENTYWEAGNPSGGGEDCIEINYFQAYPNIKPKWNDIYCFTSQRYICEKSFTCTCTFDQ